MEKKLWNRDYIAMLLANFLSFCSFYMLLAALPLHMAVYMQVDSKTIGIVVGIFSISALISRLFAGYLTDILPRKKLMSVILIFFVFSVASYLISKSVQVLFWVRLFQGLGWGLITTSLNSIVIDVMPVKRQGEGIAYFSTGSTIAMALGPVTGLTLFNQYNFDIVIYTSLGVAIVGFICSLLARRDSFLKITNMKKTNNINDFLLIRALPFLFNYLLIFFSYGVILGFITLFGKSLNINNSSWFFIIFALGILISRILSAKLLNKGFFHSMNMVSMLLLSILFILTAISPSVKIFYMLAFFSGIGFGIYIPTNQSMTVFMADKRQRGVATATFFIALDVGIGLGIMLAGSILKIGNFTDLFIIMSVLSVLGMVYYWFISKPVFFKEKFDYSNAIVIINKGIILKLIMIRYEQSRNNWIRSYYSYWK